MDDEPTDGELLRASGSDPEAFRVLYQRHAEPLLRYLRASTGDSETALELLAETLAVAYERRSRYDEARGPVGAWLCGIARRELGRARRRHSAELRAVRRLAVLLPEVDEQSWDRIDQLVDVDRERPRLVRAMERLRPRDREVVRLRVLDELDYGSISARLQCSEPAARVRVHRALSRLAGHLEVQSDAGHPRS